MSKSASRRRPLLTAVLVVLIVAVPLGVFAWGRTSGTFRVRHIVLSGARPTHDKALNGVLRRHFLGSNLFLVTTARVRSALSTFPFVAGLSVNRDFPGTLKVHMSEYVPAALLTRGGLWYVVSKEGRVLAAAVVKQPVGSASPGTGTGVSTSTSPTPGTSTSPTTSTSTAPTTSTSTSPTTSTSPSAGASPGATGSGSPDSTASPSPSATSIPRPAAGVKLPRGTRRLPVIVATTPLTVGATVADAQVRAALVVLGRLPTALRRAALGAGATDSSIRVYVTGGLTVEFGGTAHLTAKMIALKAVLGRYHARGVTCTFVDVSVPDRPLAAPLLIAGSTQSTTGATPSPGASSTASPSTSPTPAGSPTSTP
jgi:POTRA domain, FtsQ-type